MIPLMSTIALLATVPAFHLLYREFLPATPAPGVRSRHIRSASVTAAVSAASAVVWVALTASSAEIAGSDLWMPAAALAAVCGFLVTIAVRHHGVAAGWLLAFSVVFSAAVFTPLASATLFPRAVENTWWGVIFADALDLGGGIAVHVAAGVSAVVVLIATRKSVRTVELAADSRSGGLIGRGFTRRLLAAGVLLWVGWVVGMIGLELAFDDVTPLLVLNGVLAPASAAVVWVLIQRVRTGTTTAEGIVAGVVSGLVAITAGGGFLEPVWAVVTGCVAGLVASSFALARAAASGRRLWVIGGAHLLAATVGLVLLGVFGNGLGYIYTGQPTAAIAQLSAVVVAAAWSAAISALMATIFWAVHVRSRQRQIS